MIPLPFFHFRKQGELLTKCKFALVGSSAPNPLMPELRPEVVPFGRFSPPAIVT